MALQEDEYYNYLYKILLKQSNKDIIPKSTFEDLIKHFKNKEDYLKCSVLYEFIKNRE